MQNKITDGVAIAGDFAAYTGTITVGAEASNVINVAVQLKTGAGSTPTTAKALMWYLASNTAGTTRLGTAPNGGTAVGTNGSLIEWTAELSGLLVFNTSGQADINITDTGTPTMYLVIVLPNGSLAVSSAITFA